MTIDKSKEYTTQSGLEVRIYDTDAGGTHPVHGAIYHEGNGAFCRGETGASICHHLIVSGT